MIFQDYGELHATLHKTPDGVGQVYATLDAMVRIRDREKNNPNLRARVATLLTLVPERDELGEIETIYRYVRDRIRYMSDVVDVETVTTPEVTIAMGAGDCDDKSLLLATMLEAAGHHAGFVATGYKSAGVYEHVYVLAQLADASLLPLDASERNGPGWQAPGAVAWHVAGL